MSASSTWKSPSSCERSGVALGQRLAFRFQMSFQHAVVGRHGPRDEGARQGRLDDAPRREDVARFRFRGLADEGALVGHHAYQFILGQDQRGGADLRAADAIQAAQRLFAQPGSRRQLARHDGGGHMFGNFGRAVAAAGLVHHGCA
jgi:hypothetical protein